MIGKLITAKAAPWLLGTIVVLLGALALQHLVLSAAVTAAQGDRDTAQAEVASMTASRDAFELRAAELAAANREWGRTVETLQAELERAQRDARELDAQARAAIARAQAEARDADRTLKRFVEQFAVESKRPDCARALANLEAQCPALSGY